MRNIRANRVVIEAEEEGAGFAVTVCNGRGVVLETVARNEGAFDAENIARRVATERSCDLDLAQLPPRKAFESWCGNCCRRFSPEMLTGYSLTHHTCDRCGTTSDCALVRPGLLAQ